MLVDDNRCFACGTDNPDGLQLRFSYDPGGDRVETTFTPGPRYQGWQGVVHGGIVATLLDEVMAKAAARKGFAILTAEITVRFTSQAATGETLRCEAEIASVKKKVIYVNGTVSKQNGDLVARGTSKMIIVSRGQQPAAFREKDSASSQCR